jgi:hypothetical protein
MLKSKSKLTKTLLFVGLGLYIVAMATMPLFTWFVVSSGWPTWIAAAVPIALICAGGGLAIWAVVRHHFETKKKWGKKDTVEFVVLVGISIYFFWILPNTI